MQDSFLGREDPWRRDRLPTPVFLGFPGGSDGNLPAVWETWLQSLGREDLLEKEQPAAVYLPEEFNVLRSLVGYSPQSHKELDMTE